MSARRLFPVAGLALLAALAAGFVVALLHRPAGTTVRPGPRPVSVRASLSPREPQFGDAVTASADVVVDPHRLDPRSVAVATGFAPFRVVSTTRTLESAGGLSVIHVQWRLRCLEVACVPPGGSKTFRFAPLRLSYGRRRLTSSWPALRVGSRVAAADLRRPVLDVPQPKPVLSDYRLPPRATGWTLLALAALLALGGAALLLRAALHGAGPARRREAPPFETILHELAAASSNGDTGRRRRALEELARELEPLDAPLSAESRVLAWAPPDPGADAIAELASRVRGVVER